MFVSRQKDDIQIILLCQRKVET